MTTKRPASGVPAMLVAGLIAATGCSSPRQPSTTSDATGTIGFALSVPGGITIDSVDYSITGPSASNGTVDLVHSQHSLEFVVGGLSEGSGYEITISGHDTAGDSCTSAPTPFSITTLQTTTLAVTIVCTLGDGGFIVSDAGNGSVQVDASVVTLDNPTTTCPTIAAFGAANAEFETGTSTMITATTLPAGGAVSFTMVPTDGMGAGTVTPTMGGAIFTCTHPGQVQLTMTTTAPLANDAGTCPPVSQSLLITCEPPVCGVGLTDCGGTCVDVSHDTNNCGACGTACPAGDTCDQGQCKAAQVCAPGLTLCGADCVNVQSNPGNCGVCGNVCAAPTQACIAGVCSVPMCQPGFTMCGGSCVFTDGDPMNCGGCGVTCPSDQTCQQGVCQIPIAAGQDLVVFNDLNPFDTTGMQDPNNKTMVTNLITFSMSGARSASTVVLMSFGHGSQCGGDGACGTAALATTNAVIQGSGMTVQVSMSSNLTSIDPSVKVIFLWTPKVDYTVDEINAFKQFASEGGRVVFIGEHEGYYGSDGISLENSFLGHMGALMTNTGGAVDCGFNTLPASSLRPHQVTNGMTGVTIACASVIIPGPHDFPIFFDSTNTKLLAGVAKISLTPMP